jgi:hypothetical protein
VCTRVVGRKSDSERIVHYSVRNAIAKGLRNAYREQARLVQERTEKKRERAKIASFFAPAGKGGLVSEASSSSKAGITRARLVEGLGMSDGRGRCLEI